VASETITTETLDMTTRKAIDEHDIEEHDIATAAAHILREKFITISLTERTLYVKNDIVWSKAPNDNPVFVKQLSGRNPDLSKKFVSRGTFKFKKRD